MDSSPLLSNEAPRRVVCWCLPEWVLILPFVFFQLTAYSIAYALIPPLESEAFGKWAFAVHGAAVALSGVTSMMGASVLGALTDVVGRKKPILVAATVNLAPYFVLLFWRNMWVFESLFVVVSLGGATFALSFSFVTAFAPKHQRALAIGAILAQYGIGSILGPLAAALVEIEVKHKDTSNTIIIIMICTLWITNILYVYFCIPNTPTNVASVDEEEEVKEEGGEGGDVEDVEEDNTTPPQPTISSSQRLLVWEVLNPFTALGVLWKSRVLAVVGVAVFGVCLNEQGVTAVLALFVVKRVGAGVEDLAVLVVAFGASLSIATLLVFPLASKYLSTKFIVLFSSLTLATSTILMAVATEMWQFDAIFILGPFAYNSYTALSHYSSFIAPPHLSGRVLGAVGAIRDCCNAIGPLVFSLILQATCSHPHTHPQPCGITFFVAAASALLAAAITFLLPSKEAAKLTLQEQFKEEEDKVKFAVETQHNQHSPPDETSIIQ